MNDSEKTDITLLFEPGIYEIYDQDTQYSYYGESSRLSHRINLHIQQIRSGSHENYELNKALATNPTINRFRFYILHSGPEWESLAKRQACEKAYIEANSQRCFNYVEDEKNAVGRGRFIINTPILVNGVIYQSQRKAAAALGVGRTTLKRICLDPNDYRAILVPEQSAAWTRVSFFGQKDYSPSVFFSNYDECVEAGFATSEQNARRKIQRNEFGWRFAHVDTTGKALRTPYTLKPGEITYKEWIDTIDNKE